MLSLLPGCEWPRFVRRRVSSPAWNESWFSLVAMTVKQQPLSAMLSPICTPSITGGTSMVSRIPGGSGWSSTTVTRASTRPVNMEGE